METLDLSSFQKESTKLEGLSKEAIIQKYTILESELIRVVRALYRTKNQLIGDEQIQLILQDQLQDLQNKVFGKSSERYKKPAKKDDEGDDSKTPPKPRIKKLSERYPNLPVRVQVIAMDPPPQCPCCEKVMSDSGMRETTQQLTVIPKKFEIIQQDKVKYRCQCQGSIVTAPSPARIIPGSSYSDEMIQDVALSKYCDLIPIERYVKMAERSGLVDLPPHSLIETSHPFADFVSGAYHREKEFILNSRVLNADETPHRMLEGSDKKNWYLWGFSNAEHCFFECHNTRSGDVASDILLQSKCEILMSDVFSGYGKAVRVINEARRMAKIPLIRCAHCNAHARRYFYKAWSKYKEATFYLDHFHEIYQLNSESKGQAPPRVLELRAQMRPRFEAMKKKALEELPHYPKNGKYGKALRYFLNKYAEFTLFLSDPDIPIDNNAQERAFRPHVVGRKTWYGTHSERGAMTAAILFTLVESCKLNQVNPREYFDHLVQDLLAGAKPYTPYEFKQSQ